MKNKNQLDGPPTQSRYYTLCDVYPVYVICTAYFQEICCMSCWSPMLMLH